MFSEILNRIKLFFSENFKELEELNSDYYPKNYVEINGEMVVYG